MMRGRPVLFAAGLAVFAALAAAAVRPAFVWNTTASAPIGLYWLDASQAVAIGDLVAIRPPHGQAAWMDRQGYLPTGALLIKRVAAVSPSRVCRSGAAVSVDGSLRARADASDRWGRPLPQWTGCRTLTPQDLFLLNVAPRSLDSRYLGPLPRGAVVGRMHPLITQKSPADAG
jgi:conjugative transfer signal peptidase TraF